MDIILGIVFLVSGFKLSMWMGKYSGQNAFFRPPILNNPLFSLTFFFLSLALLFLGLYFLFRGSFFLGLAVVCFWLYGFIKDRKQNSDEAIARSVFNLYKGHKRVNPKEKDKIIFHKIIEDQLSGADLVSGSFLDDQAKKWAEESKDIKDVVSHIIIWRHSEAYDFSNFEKWMERTSKRDELIERVHSEVFGVNEK